MANKEADILILKSVAVCPMAAAEKDASIVVAYKCSESEKEVYCFKLPFPKKKPYLREDILAGIAETERVGRVEYKDKNGNERDIIFCRPAEGKFDMVCAAEKNGSSVGTGFCRMESGNFSFSLDQSLQIPKKPKEKFVGILKSGAGQYAAGSAQYAVINAINACLIGMTFLSKYFDLETADKVRIRFEIGNDFSEKTDDTLFIIPKKHEFYDYISHYATELFDYCDGNEITEVGYRLTLNVPSGKYFITAI